MTNRWQDSNSVWFESLSRGHPPALRLFCFPYAGGSGQTFRTWQRYFPSEVDLCLVHLPGRGRRFDERPFTRMNLLVDTIASHIEGKLPCPFAFYGHSMGALISFELARELRRRCGIEPVQLFLSGQGAPHLRPTGPATFGLSQDEFIVKLRELNGTPQELLEDAELTELILPILRADFEIVETYEYQPGACLSCPITVYGGLQDKEVPVGNLREWKEHSPAQFKVRLFPGAHFFIDASSVRFLEVLRLDISDSLREVAGRLKHPPTCSA